MYRYFVKTDCANNGFFVPLIAFMKKNAFMQRCFYSVFTFAYSKMTSLKEDVRRSAMLCVLSVSTTMTSHDLMKFVAPFNDVMEHMKIIRDSMPNQYMVLIKFATQVRSDQPGFCAVTTLSQQYRRLLL